MPTLIAETKKYTVNEEMEAIDLINSYRTRAIEGEFEMASAKYTKKEKKSKGEVVDTWFVVSIEVKYGE